MRMLSSLMVSLTLIASGALLAACGDDDGSNAPECGNGVLEAGEECDGLAFGDARCSDYGVASGGNLTCTATCTIDTSTCAFCGNGVVEAYEECDEGESNSDVAPDACRLDCVLARCGDGVVDTGEICDDGVDNSDAIPDACRLDCVLARCGDGVVDVLAGESCDDGNGVGGDGCGASCRVELCGNGVLDDGEVCDDGGNQSGDGCSSDCFSDETCGNGIVDVAVGESCDCGIDPANLPMGCVAPNGDPAGDCPASCSSAFCGNFVLDPGEECDDGNFQSGDGCSADCLSMEICGNGYVDYAVGEECDDGGVEDGDGCSATCQTE